jgi:hypothetical protein
MRLAYSLLIRPGRPDDEITLATWDFEYCSSALIARQFSASEPARHISAVVLPADDRAAPTSGLYK